MALGSIASKSGGIMIGPYTRIVIKNRAMYGVKESMRKELGLKDL